MKSSFASISFFICAAILSCSTKEKSESIKTDSVTLATESQSVPVQSSGIIDENDTSFVGFIRLFESSGTQIPERTAEVNIEGDIVGHFTTERILQVDPFYAILYVHFVPAGPGMDELHAATYTKEGMFISDAKLGSSYPSSGPDGGGKDYSYEYFPDRKVIRISDTTIEWDEGNEEDVSTEAWCLFYIDKDGKILEARKYPEISRRYLVREDVESYSKDELRIMRNEIFAVYGYIFKTEPLKSYYGAMPWYKGERDNVDDMLTNLETTNVQLIKLIENEK